MNFAELQERYDDFYTPRFTIRVGGTEYHETDGVVTELRVDTTLDGADHFAFTMTDVFDPENREFDGVDWDVVDTGVRVEVSIGYANELLPVLVGRIDAIRPEFPSTGGPTLTVSGYGLLHDLTSGYAFRSWDEATDSDVAREVAGDYEFDDVVVEETGVTHRKVIQNGESDYRFLKERADRNGFELFARLDTLQFRAPKYGTDPTVSLAYGESLTSFSPELNASGQVSEVAVRHWDPGEKTEIVGSATADGPGEGRVVLRVPVRSQEEATRTAEAALERITSGLVGGKGECIGIPEIRAGETLELSGLGGKFTKIYYIERATHVVGSSGYRTTFEVKERTI